MEFKDMWAQSMGMSGEQQGFPQNAEELQKRLFLLQTQGLEQQRQGIGQLEQQMAQRQQKQQVSPMLAILAGASDIYGGTQYGQQLLKQKSEAERQAEQDALRLQQLRGDLTGRETDLVRTLASSMREEEQFDEKMRLERAKLAKDQQKEGLLPGQEQADKEFGKTYAEWNAAGGFGTVEKQLQQLREAQAALKNDPSLTGGVGYVPEALGLRKLVNERSQAIQQQVEQAIQQSLRATLGSQFTEKEGQKVIERAFDPKLSAEENIRKLEKEIQNIATQARQKEAASRYFEQTQGTLKGFKPRGSMSEKDMQRLQELRRKRDGK